MPSRRSLKRPESTNRRPAEATLYAELVRRGLPADYARRTAEELDDHRSDLLADLRAAGADDPEAVAAVRLGETRHLAGRIASDYRRRSWCGRHPAMCFALAPIPLWLFATALCHGGVIAMSYPFGEPVGGWVDSLSDWNRLIATTSTFLAFYVLYFAVVPALLAAKLARLALRVSQRRRWVAAACVSVAFASSSICYDLRLSTEPGQSVIYLSTPEVDSGGAAAAFASLPTATLSHYFRLLPLAQLGAPLLAGALVLRRDQERRAAALLASPSGAPPELLVA